MLQTLRQHVTRLRVAYLVLILSLIPTVVVYFRVRINVDNRDRARFDRIVRGQQAAVEQRVTRVADQLFGLRGLFAVNPSVSAEQWKAYVSNAEVWQLLPGMRALGYAERVEPAQRQEFLRNLRARSGENSIQPAGDRPIYFVSSYVTAFDTNSRVSLGRDLYANPQMHPIMDEARDRGQPAVTGRLLLTNQSGKTVPGFLAFLPVYRAGTMLDKAENRSAAIQGFIFASFDAPEMFGRLTREPDENQADLEVFDGHELTAEHLLYDRNGQLHPQNLPPHQLASRVNLSVLNRTWTLYFSSEPAFKAESDENLPLLALGAWLALSLLLFGITAGQVNARQRAEKMNSALQQSETALAAEKERLAVTLYSISDGVITTNEAGMVLSLNQAAEQLTGWPQDEARSQDVGKVFNLLDEDTRQPAPGVAKAALGSGAPANLEKPGILVARDGAERLVAGSAAPIHGPGNSVIGAVLVFRDVTAKRRSEAELLKESKLESVGLLAGGIAHDFNNILQGILGNLSLARMNAHSVDKMLERLAGVEKSALRAKDLTQQLVMFARGGAPIRRQLEIAGLIRDATLFALHGTSVNCEFSIAGNLAAVEADEGQLRQVLHNIVINAVQAMPGGGKIQVRAENVDLTAGFLPPLPAGQYVKISIRDFGTGIKPEDLPRIFDPYFSTRHHSRGLGLASAHSVIRKHQGQITVESQPAVGSTFSLYLPACDAVPPAPAPDTGQQHFFGKGRVLIMDDETDILDLAGEMLRAVGYEVETAREGGEALERYQSAKRAGQPFSVVIMDLTVPQGMGGKECIARLKEMDPQARAVVSSGYSLDPVMANFKDYGFQGVIPKPYVMDQLTRVLAEVMGKG